MPPLLLTFRHPCFQSVRHEKECPRCGKRFKVLTQHLVNKHKMELKMAKAITIKKRFVKEGVVQVNTLHANNTYIVLIENLCCMLLIIFEGRNQSCVRFQGAWNIYAGLTGIFVMHINWRKIIPYTTSKYQYHVSMFPA